MRLPDLTSGPVAFDDALTPWRAWTPHQAADALTAAVPAARWAVAGGWAIDLHLGHPTRDHDDLEISVLAADVPAVLAAFPEPVWQWAVPLDGRLHRHGGASTAATHQNWLWSPAEHAFLLDVFRESHDGDTWICRRDPALRRPWREALLASADGIPHLAPEIVLLFKAKYRREKDEADLRSVLPVLDDDRRAWLAGALDRVHPDHPWREHLGPPV
ncbi:nucleotidyltransferase domain-containing protein [Pseudonocardia sp. DLS-67]